MSKEFWNGACLLRKRALINDDIKAFEKAELNPIFQKYKGEDYAYIKYHETSDKAAYAVYLNEDCLQEPTVINNLKGDKSEVHHICYACQAHYIEKMSLSKLCTITGYTNFPFEFLLSPADNINSTSWRTIKERAEKAIMDSRL